MRTSRLFRIHVIILLLQIEELFSFILQLFLHYYAFSADPENTPRCEKTNIDEKLKVVFA